MPADLVSHGPSNVTHRAANGAALSARGDLA